MSRGHDNDFQLPLRDGPLGTMLSPHLIQHETVIDLLVRAPGLVRDVHASWVEAGAGLVHTATLQVMELAGRRRRDAWSAAIELAAQAAADRATVAALVSPPSGGGDVARTWYADLDHLLEAGVAHVTCACITGTGQATAFLQAWREVAGGSASPGVAASCSLSIAPSRGADRCRWIMDVADAGSVSMGLACCEGPAGLRPWLEQLCSRHECVHVAPSAGLPDIGPDGRPAWPIDARSWALEVAALVDGLPISGVGACCGCTPDYLIALRDARV